MDIICHQVQKKSVILHSKRKQQGEDKWLGEKYHLAEI